MTELMDEHEALILLRQRIQQLKEDRPRIAYSAEQYEIAAKVQKAKLADIDGLITDIDLYLSLKDPEYQAPHVPMRGWGEDISCRWCPEGEHLPPDYAPNPKWSEPCSREWLKATVEQVESEQKV